MTTEPEPPPLAAAAERWARARADRWAPVPPELDRAIAADLPLAEAALAARRSLVGEIARRLADLVAPETIARYAGALLAVPRERFVLPEEIGASADDAPSPLDREGLATVSAPHAYLLTYALLGLAEGDHLLELGSGTGYGAALASRIVGARGLVTSIEIDPDLFARATTLLAEPSLRGPAPITLLQGDAWAVAPGQVAQVAHAAHAAGAHPLRVAVTYAIAEPPEQILALLPEGGRLIAPVGASDWDQQLARWERLRQSEGGALERTVHGAVRYVADRGR